MSKRLVDGQGLFFSVRKRWNRADSKEPGKGEQGVCEKGSKRPVVGKGYFSA